MSRYDSQWSPQRSLFIRYQGTYRDGNSFYIFMEYVSGGSIAGYIWNCKSIWNNWSVAKSQILSMLVQYGVFSVDLIRKFTRQIVCGVEYLHSKGILHRDIKGLWYEFRLCGFCAWFVISGANVLVNEYGVAKLADFGCSKQISTVITSSLQESLRSIRGSVPWMAPEGSHYYQTNNMMFCNLGLCDEIFSCKANRSWFQSRHLEYWGNSHWDGIC